MGCCIPRPLPRDEIMLNYEHDPEYNIDDGRVIDLLVQMINLSVDERDVIEDYIVTHLDAMKAEHAEVNRRLKLVDPKYVDPLLGGVYDDTESYRDKPAHWRDAPNFTEDFIPLATYSSSRSMTIEFWICNLYLESFFEKLYTGNGLFTMNAAEEKLHIFDHQFLCRVYGSSTVYERYYSRLYFIIYSSNLTYLGAT